MRSNCFHHIHISSFFGVIVLALAILLSCSDHNADTIDRWMDAAGENPDSVLNLLNKFSKNNLDEEQMAKYALCYTIAQDKSGLDVADDSLIRIAFNYYADKLDDKLAAKCHYYMGKTLWIKNETAQATYCLITAADLAEQMADTAILCIANSKLSTILRETNPEEALVLARKAAEIYSVYTNRTIPNMIYSKLLYAESLLYVDSLNISLTIMQEALNEAIIYGDSAILANTYQDISVVTNLLGEYELSVHTAELSESYRTHTSYCSKAALAVAYINSGRINDFYSVWDSIIITDCSSQFKAYIDYCKYVAEADSTSPAQTDITSWYHNMNESINDRDRICVQNARKMILLNKKYSAISDTNKKLLLVVLGFSIVLLFVLFGFFVFKKKNVTKNINPDSASTMSHKPMTPCQSIESKTDSEYQEQLYNIRLHVRSLYPDVLNQILNSHIDNKGNPRKEDMSCLIGYLETADGRFITRLRKQYPALSDRDTYFIMLIRFGLKNKEIANIYSISEHSVQQRMFVCKKKLNISDPNLSLRSFVRSI